MKKSSLIKKFCGLLIGQQMLTIGLSAEAYFVENPPKACECQFAGKDYDPAKGYYFDKVTYWPYPQVSARFGCQYYCQDSRGKYWIVTHVFEGSYFGTKLGTAENAKKNICPDSIAKFIPHYDLIGHVEYYDTEPVGNFDATRSSVKEVVDWAKASCQ